MPRKKEAIIDKGSHYIFLARQPNKKHIYLQLLKFLSHFSPNLWRPGGGKKFHLTMPVHNYK